MSLCRVLARQHGSAEDLTFLAKARRQREEGGTVNEQIDSKTTSSWTIASESIGTERTFSGKPRSRSELISDGKWNNSFPNISSF